MAPEVLMLLMVMFLFLTAYKSDGWKSIKEIVVPFGLFLGLLVWGGFFNDIGELIRVGFKKIFG